MNFGTQDLIVVTPVYEDVEASSKLFSELQNQFGDNIFVVAVDDGSVRQPLDISSLENIGVDGALLKLKRNVGHQRAIAIGLSYVSQHVQEHQRIVVMDSDGEDLPSTIPMLLEDLDKGGVDVVVARRKSRVETLRFKAFYVLYKKFFSMMTGKSISFGNFMAMSRNAVRRLVVLQELSLHVAGAVIASKLRYSVKSIHRGPRYAGQSKMNFVGLVLHGFKGLMVFAEDVLVRVGIACSLVGAFSIVGALLAVLLKLIGFSTPGWFSIALGILLLMFLQTGALALMTLILTGVVRGGSVTKAMTYEDFVDEIFFSNPEDKK